jgi:ligand-binding sensor domain-containing protein
LKKTERMMLRTGKNYLLSFLISLTLALKSCGPSLVHPATNWSLSEGRWESHATDRVFLGYPVQSLLVDGDGNLWVGTARGGGRFDGTAWQIVVDYPVGVWGITLDGQGRTWLADGYGVEVYDQGTMTTYGVDNGLTSVVVQQVLADSRGRIWVGLRATEYRSYGGIEVLEDGQWRHIDTRDFFGASVLALAEYPLGNIWAGGEGGLARFDGTKWEPMRVPDQSTIEAISSIVVDPSGRIWIGARRSGVWIWDGESWSHYTSEDGLAGDVVWSIAFDGAGRAWIGTSSGLSAFDGETWTTYTVEDGLLHNDVQALTAVDNGIWVGTWRGLCRLVFGN